MHSKHVMNMALICAAAMTHCHAVTIEELAKKGNNTKIDIKDETSGKWYPGRYRGPEPEGGYGWIRVEYDHAEGVFSAPFDLVRLHSTIRVSGKWRIDDELLVYSTTKQRWRNGTVTEIRDDGMITVVFKLECEMGDREKQIHTTKARKYLCPIPSNEVIRRCRQAGWKKNDLVEVYSDKHKGWHAGYIEEVWEYTIWVRYKVNPSDPLKRLVIQKWDHDRVLRLCQPWSIGEQVEVYSRSARRWLPVTITKVDKINVYFKYQTKHRGLTKHYTRIKNLFLRRFPEKGITLDNNHNDKCSTREITEERFPEAFA